MTDAYRRALVARFGAAEGYDAAARVQLRVVETLLERIVGRFGGDGPGRILEFGCGTGFLTAGLRRAFPEAEIVATDLSAEMVDRARVRVPDATFAVMDGEYPDIGGVFDLVCSSLCLQWFVDRQGGLERLGRLLRGGGPMMVTTLGEGSFREWREACAVAGVACGVPEYPALRVLEGEWRDGGRWERAVFVDRPGSGLGFVRDLRRIGASLPREGVRPAMDLRRAMRVFDKGERVVTYDVMFGELWK